MKSELQDLISVDDAIEQIAAAMPLMESAPQPLAQAARLVLAEDVHAKLSHPPADVSAMDGYAVRTEDTSRLPTRLKLIGESAAGHPFKKKTGKGKIGRGECVRIFTGAHCPENTDTIVLQEDTIADNAEITIREAPATGRHIRPMGSDFAAGDLLFPAGSRLSPRTIALIGAGGHKTVLTHRKPKIAILSTGDELVEIGVDPLPHQIISSNGIFLENLIEQLGGVPVPLGIIGDAPNALDAAFKAAHCADLIVTSGGASVGCHDSVAQKMHTEHDLVFARIAMRPGKPLLFGHIKSDHNGGGKSTPLLGLPGNPVSTGVCGMIFVAAAIRAMLGQEYHPQYRHAVLEKDLDENAQRQEFLRASLHYSNDGTIRATPLKGQDSGMLAVFARADGLIMRPPHAPAASAGEIVPVIILAE